MIPRLHLVCDTSVVARPDFMEVARALVGLAEPVGLHLRIRDQSSRRLFDWARALVGIPGLHVWVNDRVDVALAAEVHGVHLAGHSIDADAARALLGRGRTIGASVHGLEEATAPRVAEADFLFVGSMFETRSHPGREPEGPELLGEVVAGASQPCLAIGGITPDRVEVLCRAGAHGVAVRSGVWTEPDTARAAAMYLDALVEACGAPPHERGALTHEEPIPT